MLISRSIRIRMIRREVMEMSSIFRDVPIVVQNDLDIETLEILWQYFETWLDELSISIRDAATYFFIDFAEARCPYEDIVLPTLGKKTAEINAKKYDKMIAIYNATYNPLENYDRTEESTHERVPDLTRTESHDTTTTTDTTSNTTSAIHQMATTTTTPTNYGTTTTRKVSPYDSTGYQNAEQTDSIMSGSQAVATAYSGNPDTTDITAGSTVGVTGDITTSETGTDTTTISSSIHGNIGVTSSQQMAEQELALAAKMAIFKIIEQDLADAVLLKVW